MSPRPVRELTDVHAALATPSRRRLLALVQAADVGRDVHELGQALGLHPSTVRFHLETLAQAGLVTREEQRPSGLGRPRVVYAAVPQPVTPGYEALTRMLAVDLAQTSTDSTGHAERIGEKWAEQVVPAPAAPGTLTAADAMTRVSDIFDRLGFAPEARTVGSKREIALHGCPFRAVARDHPDVICAVHLGLLRGILDRLGAQASGRLRPFVRPDLCLVEVTPTS